MAQKGMIRIVKLPLSRVLQHIGKPRKRVWADGKLYVLRLGGVRMKLLGRTQVCACCGLKGRYFWLDHSGNRPPHLNLYAVRRNGQEVLMTMDHVLPRAKGGKTEDGNVQLLCKPCNQKKRDLELSLDELRKVI